MSRRRRVRPKRSDSFESEVGRRFGPVAASLGLQGPVEGGVLLPTVAYHADRLRYTWMLDEQEGDLSVAISLVIAEGRLAIDVGDLVPAVGLGAPQDVRTSARTWLALQHSIESHAGWIGRLHGLLTGPDAERLLQRCGARKHTPDRR